MAEKQSHLKKRDRHALRARDDDKNTMQNTTLKLKRLTCDACKKLTERKIGRLAGVASVTVDLKTGLAQIAADHEISKLEVESALKGTDYQVE